LSLKSQTGWNIESLSLVVEFHPGGEESHSPYCNT